MMRLRADIGQAEKRVSLDLPFQGQCVAFAVRRHILVEKRGNAGDRQIL